MASQWRTFQRLAENLVFSEAPKLIRQLQRSPAVQRGIKIGSGRDLGAVADPPAEITAGRPVTRTSVPTAHRARKVVYSPDLDGRADPGEVVWTWVTHEEDPTRGKDRPVLVVGRDNATLLGLMLSSQERHAADRSWLSIGSGSWDGEGRASWVRARPGARRPRRKHSSRGRDSGSHHFRRRGRPTAPRLLLELSNQPYSPTSGHLSTSSPLRSVSQLATRHPLASRCSLKYQVALRHWYARWHASVDRKGLSR